VSASGSGYLAAAGAPEPSSVLVPGPWVHREVAAHGQRFHLAECGDPSAPTVLLLHGFPEFWWSWRHQLVALGAAGLHAVAVDLRGYGASDKPPLGYDGPSLAADVAGIVRALGHTPATVVGHDWGAVLAMWAAALHPDVIDRVAVLSAAHPLRWRQAILRNEHGQAGLSAYMARFQLPRADGWLLDDDADEVARLLRAWGGPGFPDEETERRCREALRIPGAAHSALEYYRWVVRSTVRPSGVRFTRRLREPLTQPVLQLHGELDRCISVAAAAGSGRYVAGEYAFRPLPGLGHFVHEEDPALVSRLLVDWCTR